MSRCDRPKVFDVVEELLDHIAGSSELPRDTVGKVVGIDGYRCDHNNRRRDDFENIGKRLLTFGCKCAACRQADHPVRHCSEYGTLRRYDVCFSIICVQIKTRGGG